MSLDSSFINLPTVVWSGIVAALISLGGIVLSNRASIQRLKEQLEHDAREKHSDRLASLRKDVYLKLVTEMNRANAHLGTLAAKDPADGTFGEPLQAVIAELAKVQLIGSRETSAHAAELTALYGEALLRLIGIAMPMHEARTDIRIADDMYQQSFAQGQRVLGEMTAENESGSPNQTRQASLLQSFEHYRAQYASHSEDRNTAWDRYNSQHGNFAMAVLQETKRLGPAHIKLTCAIREEVGLDTDASELKRRLEDNLARANQAVDDVLDKITPTSKD